MSLIHIITVAESNWTWPSKCVWVHEFLEFLVSISKRGEELTRLTVANKRQQTPKIAS